MPNLAARAVGRPGAAHGVPLRAQPAAASGLAGATGAEILNALNAATAMQQQLQQLQQQLPPGPLLLYPLAGYTPPAAGTSVPPLEQIPLEQLRRMEGNERAAVEERLRFLRQVQAQVDGLIVALTQFQRLGDPSAPGPAAAAGSAAASAASGAAAQPAGAA